LFGHLDAVGDALAALDLRHSGDPARRRLRQNDELSIGDRVGNATRSFGTRLPATATQRRDLELGTRDLAALARDLRALIDGDIARLRRDLEAAGAPWTPGRAIPTP
jgi:hypothetical protein